MNELIAMFFRSIKYEKVELPQIQKNMTGKQMEKNKVYFKKITEDVRIPQCSKPGDAGADARIMGFKEIKKEGDDKQLIEIDAESYTLKPLERVACPLGFATAIPQGYYFKVVPRSGLALWEGLTILNTPGTIDAGYRNEWMAIVANISNKEVTLHKGERICQIILGKLHEYEVIEVDELPSSERGLGGFGSTGKK
ncbi:MAG: Deoxyuridine 5'-triphosphate nucleotidohydrolase [Promethearchaeota archaeon]|nr:MAG: Deoxyuridine 5'-triphosphate nucleotidohydrolase [Candidatus Lokiarchaeota archaeon]